MSDLQDPSEFFAKNLLPKFINWERKTGKNMVQYNKKAHMEFRGMQL